jgi:uncharacterized protein (DUF1810 family)
LTSAAHDLQRFVDAQRATYARALAEITSGQKRSHWMWYVFPQMRGLGRSDNAHFYGISSLEEARVYLADPILGKRLRECVEALLQTTSSSADEILGGVDAQKLRSSLTLFRIAGPGETLFVAGLEKFFDGKLDPSTLELLASDPDAETAEGEALPPED